jgi:hypothetical protein
VGGLSRRTFDKADPPRVKGAAPLKVRGGYSPKGTTVSAKPPTGGSGARAPKS